MKEARLSRKAKNLINNAIFTSYSMGLAEEGIGDLPTYQEAFAKNKSDLEKYVAELEAESKLYKLHVKALNKYREGGLNNESNF